MGAGGGHERGFLDLADRPLLVGVLGPAGAAAGADGDWVQTEGDGDHGRSAQRAAWHEKPLWSSPVGGGWAASMRPGGGRAVVVSVEGCFRCRRLNGGRCGGGWRRRGGRLGWGGDRGLLAG